MGCKVEACAECTQICHIIHEQNKGPSAVMTSFFKVMIGDRYSEVLFLPPRFARTSPVLIGQKTQLEDSSGERWTVTLSKVDGSLAFQEGWDAFAVDHGLKVGDFVMFYYIVGSHFVVQIYGPSGCPENRPFGDNRNQKKKIRTKVKFKAKEKPFHENINGYHYLSPAASGSENGISQCQPISTRTTSNFVNDSGAHVDTETGFGAEPFCMFDRDFGHVQGEYRSCVPDLSILETPKNQFDDAGGRNHISVGGERTPHLGDTMSHYPDKVEMSHKDPVNIPGKNVLETCVEKPTENRKESMVMPIEPICQKSEETSTIPPTKRMKVANQEPAKTSDTDSCDEMLHDSIEECSRAFRLLRKETEANLGAVKDEPVDLDDDGDIPKPDATNISCLVVIGTEPYLELPTSFPSTAISRRTRTDRKVVLLRGPNGRCWPVLYFDKYFLKVLTSGWEAFRKANWIHPGDECVFQLENQHENIFRVRINH